MIFGRDKNTGRRLGFCILEFEEEDSVDNTLKKGKHFINGKIVKVQEMLLRHELKEKQKNNYTRSEKTYSHVYSGYNTTKDSSNFKGHGRSEGGKSFHGRAYNNHHHQDNSNRGKNRKFKNFRGRGYGYNSNNSEDRNQTPGGYRSSHFEREEKFIDQRKGQIYDNFNFRENHSENFHSYSLPTDQGDLYTEKNTLNSNEAVYPNKVKKKANYALTGSSDTRIDNNFIPYVRYDSLIPTNLNLGGENNHQHEEYFRSNTTKEEINIMKGGLSVSKFAQKDNSNNQTIHRSNTDLMVQDEFTMGNIKRQETWKKQFQHQNSQILENEQIMANYNHRILPFKDINNKPWNRYNMTSPLPQNQFNNTNDVRIKNKIEDNEEKGKYNQPNFLRFQTLNTIKSKEKEREDLMRFKTLPAINFEGKLSNESRSIEEGKSKEDEEVSKEIFQPNYQNLGIFLNEENDEEEENFNDESSLSDDPHNLNENF